MLGYMATMVNKTVEVIHVEMIAVPGDLDRYGVWK